MASLRLGLDVLASTYAVECLAAAGHITVRRAHPGEADDVWVASAIRHGANLIVSGDKLVAALAAQGGVWHLDVPEGLRRQRLIQWLIDRCNEVAQWRDEVDGLARLEALNAEIRLSRAEASRRRNIAYREAASPLVFAPSPPRNEPVTPTTMDAALRRAGFMRAEGGCYVRVGAR